LATISKISQALRHSGLRRALLRHFVLGGAEHRFLLSSDLATVVDIGANRGQFALAVREWAPRAHVYSFEPLSGPASVFRRVFADDPQVSLHQIAIGPESQRRTMHICRHDDSSSLLPIAPIQPSIFPGNVEVGTSQVQVAQLSEFITAEDLKAPAMLKLDVQGFEYQALIGCSAMLPCFQWIYCECSFVELYTGQKLAHDVIALLAGHGFVLDGVYNVASDSEGRCVQADLLFLTSAEKRDSDGRDSTEGLGKTRSSK
jgi:FkbM family methyltransferase